MTIALSLDDHQAVVQLTAAGLYLGRTPPADRGRGAQVIAAETTAQVSSTDGRVTITLRRRVSPGGPSRLPADGRNQHERMRSCWTSPDRCGW